MLVNLVVDNNKINKHWINCLYQKSIVDYTLEYQFSINSPFKLDIMGPKLKTITPGPTIPEGPDDPDYLQLHRTTILDGPNQTALWFLHVTIKSFMNGQGPKIAWPDHSNFIDSCKLKYFQFSCSPMNSTSQSSLWFWQPVFFLHAS